MAGDWGSQYRHNHVVKLSRPSVFDDPVLLKSHSATKHDQSKTTR
jgi:hypothetical protein